MGWGEGTNEREREIRESRATFDRWGHRQDHRATLRHAQQEEKDSWFDAGEKEAKGQFMVWRKVNFLIWEIEGKITSKEAEEETGKLQPNQVAARGSGGPAGEKGKKRTAGCRLAALSLVLFYSELYCSIDRQTQEIPHLWVRLGDPRKWSWSAGSFRAKNEASS